MESNNVLIMAKARRVLALMDKVPNGTVYDADTVLADIMEEADYCETDIGRELIGIWIHSKDQTSVEGMFFLLTGMSFEAYLDRCIRETTRKVPVQTETEQAALEVIESALVMQGYKFGGYDGTSLIVHKPDDPDTCIRISAGEEPA